ncbi:MAG: hypothetical protein WC718_17395 [Phycisphaerales bacterium]
MTTTIVIPDAEQLPEKFGLADAVIATLSAQYMPLTIAGVDDEAGFACVHAARIVVKDRRIAVEKTRKELKADALKYGQAVDAEARRITKLLEPIEEHLESEEERIKAERYAIKHAARLAEEEAFRKKAEEEQAAFRAAQEKLAAEQAALEAEKAAIAASKAKEEAERRAAQDKLDAERRAVEAEQRRLADIETARKHAEELEKTRAEAKVAAEKAAAEAALKARAETEARLAREAVEREAKQKALAEEAERARLKAEMLMPDRKKLEGVVAAIRAITIPVVSPAAQAAAEKIAALLDEAQADVQYIIDTRLGGKRNGGK